jgi:hypothetical protein
LLYRAGGVANADNKTGNGHFFIFRVLSVQYIKGMNLSAPVAQSFKSPGAELLVCRKYISAVQYEKYIAGAYLQ